MMNDIKLNTLSTPLMPNRETLPSSSDEAAELTETSAVTVNPHLGKLASTLTDEAEENARAERIVSLKTLIDNNQYRIDMKSLVRQLANSSLITKGM